jgi:hypothetical protein
MASVNRVFALQRFQLLAFSARFLCEQRFWLGLPPRCGSLRLCAEPQRREQNRELNAFEEGLMRHDILLNRISTEKNALLTV